MNLDDAIQVQAWLDDELPAREAEEVARRVAADPDWSATADELRATRTAVREHAPAVAVPDGRDFYWSQIRRGIEAAGRQATPSPAGRRASWAWLWRLALPLGAAAAVALLFLRSTTPNSTTTVAAASMVDHEVDTPRDDMAAFTFHSQADAVTVVWVENASAF